jgi:radical SAM superfamily enzyme YgiQ (UPF0313 family)
LKLLLVLPENRRSYWGGVSRSGKAGFARLSLTTVAALTPADWDVTIHDARTGPVNPDLKPDLVGITGITSEMPSAYAVADSFRLQGVPVVMGGVHVSAMPDEALVHADAVVIGEAEPVWARLLKDFKTGSMKKKYNGSLCDMRDMVVPRRDLLDRNMYSSGFNTLQATRGCPFACSYCTVTAFFGNEFRTRPVEQVIEEVSAFDTRDFFFMDDNIVGRPAYARELFEKLMPLGKTWGSQASITLAKDPELLRLYAASGGRYAFIGFESLSQKNLNNMKKGWNSSGNYAEAVKKIHAAGVEVVASFVFGLDDDDRSVFQNTYDFITENGISAAQYHILTPLPGTATYRQMEDEERITERDWSKYHTGEVVFTPTGMTQKELLDGYHWIFKKTYSVGNIIARSFRTPRGIARRVAANMSYRRKAMRMP